MVGAFDPSDDMRRPAEWMVPADDRILELIEEKGNLTPQAIDELGGPVANYASTRCTLLTEAGFLDRIAHGLYGITDQGIEYLDGEFDATDLPRPDPDN